ncbi:dihydroorotate dehydrogenase-like protein [Mesoterricola sediminis]|uniref:Dihydroorotate dehydrogenase n=1 Tax=Mesoterricola sediminis TaxID=2927980 RepID=A0AA48KE44_9BACT|nr:dihydroorotate dehydrogenase-like protein [Mesoterricola sediminis]BDU77690.1 dihydroorotate dehydrogenase [Mesoterricola sediminis]
MNLKTTYLGLPLEHPVMAGASPLGADLDAVRRLEDAGAAAITLPSLFEEQITREESGTLYDLAAHAETFAEATSYFPRFDEMTLGPESYLTQLQRVKAAVRVPVIASLNGITNSGWLDYARKMQDAGADALELNIYYLATNPLETSDLVERRTLEIVRTVKSSVTIPVAVKLSPFFSSLAHYAKVLEGAGADAIVLFNRFYQPDLDIENLEVTPALQLSSSSTLRMRLRWLAILWSHVGVPMAVTGGVHTPEDAVKATMAGATGIQMVSALLKHGPERLTEVRDGLAAWMEEHEYESLDQMRGSMSLVKCPNPQAFERANYMRVLQGWKA